MLEARIFVPTAADALWLTRTDAIGRVFAEIKHLVLPMLAEARNLRGAARVRAREKQVVVGGMYHTRNLSPHWSIVFFSLTKGHECMYV